MTNRPLDLSNLNVLAVFAHPDDEGFGCGGVLAMLVSRGASVTLVCATNGDVGEISDPSLATPETLSEVRQEELRRAMNVTGVQDIRFLGYRDSGMAGTEENNHPNSLFQADPGTVVERLVEIFRSVSPDIVFTHDPSGGYGHPDHVTVYQRTTSAFSEALGSTAPKAPLLYYVCFPRSAFRRMWQQMLDSGITPPFASEEVDTIGSPDEDVTTTLDVTTFVDTKIASLECHQTQLDPNGPFAQMPKEFTREIMSAEYFALAHPENASGEADLLAKLWET
jgi:LmbE family N-acetylglucosaminyl deacetylase